MPSGCGIIPIHLGGHMFREIRLIWDMQAQKCRGNNAVRKVY